jgi:hypothetical protein
MNCLQQARMAALEWALANGDCPACACSSLRSNAMMRNVALTPTQEIAADIVP